MEESKEKINRLTEEINNIKGLLKIEEKRASISGLQLKMAENGFWQEATSSSEAARALVQAGDTSLTVHSDQPIADLFGLLGRAYLGAGRCVDAEMMLEYAISIGAPASRAIWIPSRSPSIPGRK